MAEGRGGGGASLRKPEVYVARRLRRSMSLPEAMLWQRLKGQSLGVKVRRQHPIGPYVSDFYVPTQRLVIEVDGEGHNLGDRPARDAAREEFMTRNGYDVMHIPAFEIMKDLNAVLEAIAARVTSPLHHPADGPPPHAGEDI